jgi:hypothetical protein
MNARGRPPPFSPYITVTVIHAPRLSTDKLTAGQAGAPSAAAVRHDPPRPPKPSAIGYKRNHPARPAITEVDIRLSADAASVDAAPTKELVIGAVVLRMLVGTVLLSGGVLGLAPSPAGGQFRGAHDRNQRHARVAHSWPTVASQALRTLVLTGTALQSHRPERALGAGRP